MDAGNSILNPVTCTTIAPLIRNLFNIPNAGGAKSRTAPASIMLTPSKDIDRGSAAAATFLVMIPPMTKPETAMGG